MSVFLPSVTQDPPDTFPLLPGPKHHIQETRAEDLVSLVGPSLQRGRGPAQELLGPGCEVILEPAWLREAGWVRSLPDEAPG